MVVQVCMCRAACVTIRRQCGVGHLCHTKLFWQSCLHSVRNKEGLCQPKKKKTFMRAEATFAYTWNRETLSPIANAHCLHDSRRPLVLLLQRVARGDMEFDTVEVFLFPCECFLFAPSTTAELKSAKVTLVLAMLILITLRRLFTWWLQSDGLDSLRTTWLYYISPLIS